MFLEKTDNDSLDQKVFDDLGCLAPLSTMFQLYRGGKVFFIENATSIRGSHEPI